MALHRSVDQLSRDWPLWTPLGGEPRMNKPRTVAVEFSEGEKWCDWPANCEGLVHAIKFADGSVWDATNGWREYSLDVTVMPACWRSERVTPPPENCESLQGRHPRPQPAAAHGPRLRALGGAGQS